MAEKAGFLSKVMPQGSEALGVLTRWLQVSPSEYTVRESSYTSGPKHHTYHTLRAEAASTVLPNNRVAPQTLRK